MIYRIVIIILVIIKSSDDLNTQYVLISVAMCPNGINASQNALYVDKLKN